ncbi:MAG: T9SS C-terminal target domain-containing protein [Calditrichaeota bacterium]|nr:MAG: T9SS C-terminal target domain-containing protein [Calditrichota bacterium]
MKNWNCVKSLSIGSIVLSTALLQAQDVIINEWSQGSGGSKEWVELLVVTEGTDMRSWDLGDNTAGDLTFTTDGNWSSLPSGSLIVIYNASDKDTNLGADDTNFADGVVTIPHNNSTFFTGTWGAFSNSTSSDNPHLRNSSDVTVHDFNTNPGSTRHPEANESTNYTSNTAGGISDENNWANDVDATSATPAAGNGGDNTTWVNSLISDGSLPVELSKFIAESRKKGISLSWVTESETQNLGFIVMRSDSEPNSFEEVDSYVFNPILRGQGSTPFSTNYSWLDSKVQNNSKYFYYLVDVDYDGNKIEHKDQMVSVIAEIDEKLTPVEDFVLRQNYPNPFNPSTTIDYNLETTNFDFAKIGIYNSIGEKIKEFELKETSGSVTWNGTNELGKQVASGTYFYKIETDSFSETRKMLLLK